MTYGRPRGPPTRGGSPGAAAVGYDYDEGRGERGNGGREPVEEEEEAVAPTTGR